MPLPIGTADLVGDQTVAGLRIGDAQQRLGKTHEDDTLVARQLVFAHERIEPATPKPRFPHDLDQPCRGLLNALERGARQRRLRQSFVGACFLVRSDCPPNGVAQRTLCNSGFVENHHPGTLAARSYAHGDGRQTMIKRL